MRPETLNPLFAETESLEGVGPKLKKPLEKLGLTRVISEGRIAADRDTVSP